MRCTACSGGLHAADVSHVAKELVEEQPEEYTGEEDAEPYFYPSWERDGLKLWPVLVRPVHCCCCASDAGALRGQTIPCCRCTAAIIQPLVRLYLYRAECQLPY